MKWLIMLLVAVLPVIASAEDDTAPVPDQAGSTAPVVEEAPKVPDTPEQGKEPDPLKPAESVEKPPPKSEETGNASGVRFQSVDELNKRWR